MNGRRYGSQGLLWPAVAAVLVACSGSGVLAGPATREPARVFAGAGTPSTAGVFFPGSAVYDGSQLQGVPHVIERGQDVLLTNLDNRAVSNCHQLHSLDERRDGRPLFTSKMLCEPFAQSVVRTSRLAPGTYGYVCAVHSGMLGLLEVQ